MRLRGFVGRIFMQQTASAGKESSARRSRHGGLLWSRRGVLTVVVSVPANGRIELERKRGRPWARAC